MRKEDDKPNCCEEGNKFIYWDDFEIILGSFRGWRMTVDYEDSMEYEGVISTEISYCPFCGKRLDKESVKNVHHK